ncbi:MAG: hypothetical protein UY92_C0004G0011 [Candidatus Magasanikbacteria bacterium GW2011_GWA2_56_11]|uniref:Uncharacterized protein n=1 Tax=Candidatus Magasanikbacteria bacterium GW2011_GWA2_56_11 TaxID=1619044 RepID=A0A0G1YHL3_9BACT|nr:MAG: hypothetical protein UY92_C0004G0011 [Candidatus Magasanikbacteria bacterium GW2011_GWA2_56_11]
MMALSLKTKILLLAAAVLTATAVIVVAVILPSVAQVKRWENYIRAASEEVNDNYERTSQLRRSISKLTEVREATATFKDFAVSGAAELELIKSFEERAERLRLTQSLNVQYSPGSKTDPGGIHRGGYYTFTFHNSGAFASHIEYLKELERLPYYVIIPELSWNRGARDGSVTLDFTAKIYSRE